MNLLHYYRKPLLLLLIGTTVRAAIPQRLRGKQAVISAREGAGQDRAIATARPLKLTKANIEHQFGFFICEKVVEICF